MWFVLILAMIPASLWLLKRSGLARAGSAPSRLDGLQTTAQLVLGPGQRVVTVEVGSGEQRTCLVLGVTPQHIQTLHSFAAPASPAPLQTALPAARGFAGWLQRASEMRAQAGDRS